jgi:hypothetical protein
LYRYFSKLGFQDCATFCSLTDQEIDIIVTDLKKTLPHVGERVVLGHFRHLGIFIRDHRIDPINTTLRWSLRIHRRSYSVPGPNSLWHIGNE